ncbi:MAG: type VI secretion system baseplate subunit TssG [Pseudomonadota bacterium]
MASSDREPSRALERRDELIAELHRNPHRFSFYQAMRLLEATRPDVPGFGKSRRPKQDPVRLGQDPDLAFPPATIKSYGVSETTGQVRLAQSFLGLFGPHGPLPLQFTEYVHNRAENAEDPTLAAFVDILHHRFISFYFRAWANSRPTFSAPGGKSSDGFAEYAGALAGVRGERETADDDQSSQEALYFAGHFSNQSRHAEGLQNLISERFKVDTEIECYVGTWLEVDPSERNAIGTNPETTGLGTSLILGGRVWDVQQKILIRITALDVDRLAQFLPGAKVLSSLGALVVSYAGWQMDWEINLGIKRNDVPPLKLDGSAQLGWSSWLNEPHRTKDANDIRLSKSTVMAHRGTSKTPPITPASQALSVHAET